MFLVFYYHLKVKEHIVELVHNAFVTKMTIIDNQSNSIFPQLLHPYLEYCYSFPFLLQYLQPKGG